MMLTGLVRLGRDAEVRFLANGDAVANLALAYNYGKKDADGKRQTQWVDAALFGKRAEALAPYLLKGVAVDVVIEDTHIDTYEKKDGTTGYSLRGRILALEFAGSAPQQRDDAKPAPKTATKPAAAGGSFADMEDDLIPF